MALLVKFFKRVKKFYKICEISLKTKKNPAENSPSTPLRMKKDKKKGKSYEKKEPFKLTIFYLLLIILMEFVFLVFIRG